MYHGFFEKLYKDSQLGIKEINFYEGKYAVFYDELLRDYNDEDIYKKQASIAGNKVLELACGAGRLGIPLAKSGFQVYGIDITQDMLDLYQKKIDHLPLRVRKRITLMKGDITDFQTDDTFDLIFFPATTICLFSDEQIAKIFHFVEKHLNQNGRFVFDRAIVNNDIYFHDNGLPMFLSWEEDNSHNIAWFQEFVLPEEKIIEADIYCESIHENNMVERFIGNTRKRIITDEIVKNALKSCSLTCIEQFQIKESYQKTEFFVLEKR